jgi:hypothetical protein
VARGENPREEKVPMLKGKQGGFSLEDRLQPLDDSSKLGKDGIPDLGVKSKGNRGCSAFAAFSWII